MKFVLFSDLHLDIPFAWLGAHQRLARQRRQGLRDTLLRITQLVHEVQADALLCGGDLYEHDRVSPDTAQFLLATFAQLSVPVYIAPGNHDWYGPQSLYCQLPWSPNVHIFQTDRLEPVPLADGLTLWGGAHCAPANTDGFLESFRVDRDGVHLALFHGSEQSWLIQQESGKIAHAPFSVEQISASGIDHCFLGHYHLPRDAARHTYPGNPFPLTFGEQGERGAVTVTVAADGSVQRERRGVASMQAHDRFVNVTGCMSQQEVRERVSNTVTDLRGIARVTLSGELGPEVDLRLQDLETTAPWLDALVVQTSNMYPAYDLATLAQEQTVRGQFVRDVHAAPDLSDEERRRILITGLRALAGRDDLEVL